MKFVYNYFPKTRIRLYPHMHKYLSGTTDLKTGIEPQCLKNVCFTHIAGVYVCGCSMYTKKQSKFVH